MTLWCKPGAPGSLKTDNPSFNQEEHTIGTWNVRTVCQAGKAAQIAAEMRNYNVVLLGISEAGWTQAGKKRLMSGEMLLYSGHEEAPHTEGVALMLSQSAQRALIGWEAHGPRVITATFRTKENICMNVIQYQKAVRQMHQGRKTSKR
jgi:hypothetical protein